MRSAGKADTMLSMAKALQCEVDYWRREKTAQHTHSNSSQRVSRSWLQHESAFDNSWAAAASHRLSWHPSHSRLPLSVCAAYCAVQGGSSSGTWCSCAPRRFGRWAGDTERW